MQPPAGEMPHTRSAHTHLPQMMCEMRCHMGPLSSTRAQARTRTTWSSPSFIWPLIIYSPISGEASSQTFPCVSLRVCLAWLMTVIGWWVSWSWLCRGTLVPMISYRSDRLSRATDKRKITQNRHRNVFFTVEKIGLKKNKNRSNQMHLIQIR